MNTALYTNELISVLKVDLPTSTGEQRKKWAKEILLNKVSIMSLSQLVQEDKKVATRFLWLLSDIGEIEPDRLLIELPDLLNLCFQKNKNSFITSFATFWNISGVPKVNEAQAIDLLFTWVLSKETNVTTKSRSINVLLQLTKKYPELKNELKNALENQVNQYSINYRNKLLKVLNKLEKMN